MKILRLLAVFALGLLAGACVALYGGERNAVVEFTAWRASGFMGGGALPLILNNVFVLAAIMYGGVFFALLEIESFEKFPQGVYGLLDKTVRWMHYLFSLFDERIDEMKNPMKSCYFITATFPLAVVFINSMVFANLIAYGLLAYGINRETMSVIAQTGPVAAIEFAGMIAAAAVAYGFTRRSLDLYLRNDHAGYRSAAEGYLKSTRNIMLLAGLSALMAAAGFIENALM